ncbi:outer membrane protein assembly factor BamE [Arboricoccus pini]|uniref:outer membrane protein assembly factor BamE n=1 Tax=Arboricoccus pini TaxID=1963835 RepID=UPI0013FE1DBC|nr:outer membrane protein assembly factor BamE [Arboricoccus pini]
MTLSRPSGKALCFKPLSLASSLAAIALLAACSPTIDSRGYQFDQGRIDQITPGVTSREEVARILGTPSTTATFNDSNWYYISQRYERRSFFQDNLVKQDVVDVVFNDNGIVSSVNKSGLDNATAVKPMAQTTPTGGAEMSAVAQFISNIGRFNPTGGGATPGQRPGGTYGGG